MNKLHKRPEAKEQRRALRAAATRAERLLWGQLRDRRTGRKFRRQHSIGPYTLDFYCPAERLAIELDGAAHDSAEAESRDGQRDAFLRRCRIRTLRFMNSEVEQNLAAVIAAIVNAFVGEEPV